MGRSAYNVNGSKPSRLVKNIYADVPLAFAVAPGILDVRPLTDIDAIKQAVKHLVLSNHGERPFQPELGCSVTNQLFENADIFTAITIKDEIIRVLSEHEPRVKEIDVEVYDQAERNALYVTIKYSVQQTNIRDEVSFYLNRVR